MSSAAHLYAELADVIIPEDCANLGSDNEKAQAFIQHLEYLIADIGLPNRLASVEVNEDALPMLAKDAMKQERLLINNPRPMNEADILAIYQAAY